MPITNTPSLSDGARGLLDGRNFATVATINADGSPQSSVVWIARDGDAAVFTTRTDRQKARNLVRDPRISVSVFDVENPYHAIEIRGRAELIDDPEKRLPKQLSQKYVGEDPPPEDADRFIVRVVPEKVVEFSA
jgi:PPOX class probable F420-dependent enzyme